MRNKKPLSRLLVVLISGLLLAVGLAACGDEDGSTSETSVPDKAVAVVGDAEVSREALDERVDALKRTRPQAAEDSSSESDSNPVEQEALKALVLEEALAQEATDREIEVPDAELEQQWDSIKAQYPTKAALRRYLNGRTKQDVLNDVRVRLLTIRIEGDVKEKAGGGIEGDDAVAKFRQSFSTRWREQTDCTQDQATGLCADGE